MDIDLLISDGDILSIKNREVVNNSSIAVKDGEIIEIGKKEELEEKYRSEKKINASDKIVMPGLINTHTHLGMTLFRGVNDDISGMKWLERAWKIESNLTETDVYWASKLGALEFIKTGTTTFSDHYFNTDKVADVVKETGIRGVLARPIFDEGGPDIDTSLKTGMKFTRKYDGYADGRVKTLIGPHATYSCSPALLEEIGEIARKEGYGVHIHMAEGEDEIEDLEEKYGKRPVKYLEDTGILKSHLIGAHAVYVNEEEISILKENNINVSHQPTAKMRGGEKAAPIPEMLNQGVNVSMGTDGAGSKNHLDLFSEMNISALINKFAYKSPTAITAWEILEMATINGAKSLGLEDKIGSIEPGKKADLILISTDKPEFTPYHNLPSMLVYGTDGSNVDSVIVDGEVIMENKETSLEEKEIKEKGQEIFENLIDKSDMRPKDSGVPVKK